MFSVKVAYQRDGNFVGPLSFSDEQLYSYGQNRINGFIQYRLVWYKPNKDLTDVQMMCDSCSKKVKIRINKAHELTTRIEYEWILGNLSDYPHSNQYVFNPHLFVQYTRPSWRALGFLVHTYYGRDYSNVRYDLPIFTIMGGISISFHKYRPMFSKKQTYTDSL